MSTIESLNINERITNDTPISEIKTFSEKYGGANNGQNPSFLTSVLFQNMEALNNQNNQSINLDENSIFGLTSDNYWTNLRSINLNYNEDPNNNDDNNNNSLLINEINSNKNINSNNLRKNKRNDIFKIIYPKQFIIFNRGWHNINIRKKISDIIMNENKQIFLVPQKTLIRKDNTRKKIKSRFLKSLKNRINEKLKSAGSQKLFDFLPQNFICNVSRRLNGPILYWTFKKIYSYDFNKDQKISSEVDLKKYLYNKSVLEYLENHEEISKKSNYNIIKNMTYYQIYEEYLNSKEFEIEISSLKRKNKKDVYIKKYIKLAHELNHFFN